MKPRVILLVAAVALLIAGVGLIFIWYSHLRVEETTHRKADPIPEERMGKVALYPDNNPTIYTFVARKGVWTDPKIWIPRTRYVEVISKDAPFTTSLGSSQVDAHMVNEAFTTMQVAIPSYFDEKASPVFSDGASKEHFFKNKVISDVELPLMVKVTDGREYSQITVYVDKVTTIGKSKQ